MKFYTGIGSRQTPEAILTIMTGYAQLQETKSWVLRSGGATGADTAFQNGVRNPEYQRIFIPWNGFNGLRHNPERNVFLVTQSPHYEKAIKLAKSHYKSWDSLKDPVKNLHARNMFQLLGEDLNDPSEFIVFWAETHPKYGFKGGTGFTVRVGRALKIPYHNLADSHYEQKLKEALERQQNGVF